MGSVRVLDAHTDPHTVENICIFQVIDKIQAVAFLTTDAIALHF